jgi:hypothetical protein
MSNLERATTTTLTLFRQLPVPARVTVVVIGLVVTLYLWQVVMGLVFIAAFFIGLYTMIRWFVK